VISGYGVPPTVIDIVNISEGGALIRWHGASLPKGEEVILTVGKLVVVATVAWAKDNMDGLTFHRPIESAMLDKLNRQLRATPRARTGASAGREPAG
jgi:hypothetical protein